MRTTASVTHPPEPTTPAPAPEHPRRILVTGGSGFIGSHLTDLLLSQGHAVTVVDNLSTGRRENLPRSHPRLTFLHMDLADALRGALAPAQFDQIYHLAAAVGVKLVVEDPIRCVETNILDTCALLRYATTHGKKGGGAATLVASTSEVYGKGSKSPFAEDDDVVYGPTTMSRWSYATSKAVDEYLALAYHRQGAVPTVVSRFFNTVGPRQVGEYGMVLPRFVQAALKGEPLQIYGDGRQSRCFCDVRDVVAVLPRLLGTPACLGRVFNVGSERVISIEELADLVIATLGSASTRHKVPYSEAYPPGFEDLRLRKPDLARIKTAVGWDPRISLEETIRDLAAWMGQTPSAPASTRTAANV